MKRQVIILLSAVMATLAADAQVTFTGTRVIETRPAASTGLAAVYTLENGGNATITYTSGGGNVVWQRYSNMGGGYAEDVTPTRDGNNYSLPAGNGDMGYIITEGGRQTCFWVTDYAHHAFDTHTFAVTESGCDRVYFTPDRPTDEIAYYTVNGRREVLDRDIQLNYYTLEYDEESNSYVQIRTTETYEALGSTFSAPAPFCDTQFILTPDRFARQWGLSDEVAGPNFNTSAVALHSSAEQIPRGGDNEQKVEAELGGSAPCEIRFSAAVTDAAVFRRWEMSQYAEFQDVTYTYEQLDFTYTFLEAGTTYVRFVANNAEGTCEQIGDTYTVTVGDSRLECPNAFSPGASEGVNDEWKVSYRSIVSFDCRIFNRWGQCLAHLTDPSQGWDGRHGGKVVGSGVYFYVIKARGADGKEYNLSGDINIIGSRDSGAAAAPVE